VSAFLSAPAVVQFHLIAAVFGVLLTPLQWFVVRRGTPLHRWIGRFWALTWLSVAVTSLWIAAPQKAVLFGFGPIHVLSILTLVMLPLLVYTARRKLRRAHRGIALFTTAGFLIAGAFTFLPGRIMNALAFGGSVRKDVDFAAKPLSQCDNSWARRARSDSNPFL